MYDSFRFLQLWHGPIPAPAKPPAIMLAIAAVLMFPVCWIESPATACATTTEMLLLVTDDACGVGSV